MPPGEFQKTKRGIFGLSNWDPLRKPAVFAESDAAQKTAAAKPPTQKVKILAKYNYKASPSSPIGKELTIKQGEFLWLLKRDSGHDHWWLAENMDGDVGFVPISYMMAVDEKPSSLPWLTTRQVQEVPQEKPVWKPYVSAYSKPAAGTEGGDVKDDAKQYYCELCAKQLNGPQPYSAHMNSKAHKEEVELAKEYAREGNS